jgi:hypothetical protein
LTAFQLAVVSVQGSATAMDGMETCGSTVKLFSNADRVLSLLIIRCNEKIMIYCSEALQSAKQSGHCHCRLSCLSVASFASHHTSSGLARDIRIYFLAARRVFSPISCFSLFALRISRNFHRPEQTFPERAQTYQIQTHVSCSLYPFDEQVLTEGRWKRYRHLRNTK